MVTPYRQQNGGRGCQQKSFDNGRRTSSIEKKFDRSHIKSRKLLILLLAANLVEFIQFLMVLTLETLDLGASTYIITLIVSFYLFYPVLGYVGEKYTRYKVILVGIASLAISTWFIYGLFVSNMNTTNSNAKLALHVLEGVFLVIGIMIRAF